MITKEVIERATAYRHHYICIQSIWNGSRNDSLYPRSPRSNGAYMLEFKV